MNTKKTIKFLSKFDTDIQLIEIFELHNKENETFLFDDFRKHIVDSILNFEITYYSRPIEYLKEKDNSLTRSLKIANKQGFELSKLNSEILATLLYQDKLYNELWEIEGEIMEYFEKNNTGLGLGSEEIVNGTFDTDSNWVKGTGWSIANGVATYDGTGGVSAIKQNLSISLNTTYEVKVTVVSNKGTGNNPIYIGSDIVNTSHLDVGTYTFYGTSASGTSMYIFGRSGEEFSIDNVSVREVTEVNTINLKN